MFPNYSNVFNNHYYETVVPFAHDQQQQLFPIQSPSFDLASIVFSSSKQDQDLLENTAHHDHLHTPFSHIYFPSPLEDGEVILQQQQQQQQQQVLHQQQQKPVITTTKRSCKKDRHSKIRTARGLRDRRMRLSLDVAKKFFGLQDMLGFDKASKTVQWLLTQAGDNIRKLASDVCGQIETQSSFSECEMVSGTEDAATGDVVDDDKPIRGKPSSSSCAKNGIKKTNVRKPKNAMLNNLAKASRKKARERARERTREKKERQQAKPCNDANQEAKKLDELSRLMSSWSQSHNDFNTSSFEVVLGGDEVVEEPPSIFQAPRRDDLMNEIDGQDARYAANFVTTGKWSPCDTILSYLQNTSASISQEIADSAMYGKPWEVIDLQQ